MKTCKAYKIFNKTLVGLFTMVIVIGLAIVWSGRESKVQAENAVITEMDDYLVKTYENTDISEWRTKDNLTAPVLDSADHDEDDWLFSGWYTDKTCTKALSSSQVCKDGESMTGTYYAKFTSADVLTVKCQITTGTTEVSGESVLRTVSSVDSLKYKSIGLELVLPNGTTKYMSASKVGTRINARNDVNMSAYAYSPKAIDTESEYFFSATETISNTDEGFSKEYLVRPYWVTKDGTKVYGQSRCVSINEGLENSTLIHVPVKMDGEPAEDATFTSTGVTASAVTFVEYDEATGYGHFALTVEKTNLKSVTEISILQDTETIGTNEYRYFGTKYAETTNGDTTYNTADATWYKDYETEDEFIIATSADLYGLAKSSETFSGKTIYVVADIEANKGRADTSGWLSTDEEGNTIEGATSYRWTSIYFQGVFDAQMHTISGIYMNDAEADSGLFKKIYSNTIVCNLKLTNSYFKGGSGQQRIGSIAGSADGGTLESVYSDAVVGGSSFNIGGLVGRQNRNQTAILAIKNCWYAGTVSNTSTHTGGLVGNSLSAVTFINCLNTGTVHGEGDYVGGFTGNVDDQTVKLTNCLNSGSVTGDANYVGAIAGYITSDGKVTSEKHTFMTAESSAGAVNGETRDDVTSISATKNAGIKALTADTKELFSYITDETTQANESYWAIVSGGTPVLASFKEFAKVDGKNVGAMAVDTSWYNTVDTEFVLSNAADLYGLALLSQNNQFSDITLKLDKDITINAGDAKDWGQEQNAPSHNWLPIGTSSKRFGGIFDGQMHTISGMYMQSDAAQVGMFGNTNSVAVVKNLKLVNSYFATTKDSVGSIAGYGYGTFDTIYSNATVKGGSAWIGGLIGITHGGATTNMNNCWFNGEVIQTGEGNANEKACVGGLIGLARNVVTISNCLSTGEISSAYTVSEDPCVGGLVGRVTGANDFILENSFDTGTVKVADTATAAYGPIAGSVETTGETTIIDNFAYSKNYVTDASTFYTGVTNVSESDILGTDALKKMTLLFTNQVSDTEYASCWAVVVGQAPVLESFAEMTGTEFLAIDTSWYNGDGNYIISDASDLYGFALMSYRTNFPSETIAINEKVDEIRINEGKPYGENGIAGDEDDWTPKYEWISITPATSLRFAGTFDGNMKTISGIYMNSTKDYSGFFGLTMPSAVVKNLSLEDSYFESANIDLGSVIGNARGTIQNVYSNANVVSDNKDVGGLVGRVSGSTEFIMDNCWFNGTVTNNGNSTSRRYTGGLIGSIGYTTTITNSLNSGKIAAPNYTVGESSTNTGSIRPHIGGVVGAVDSGKTLNVTNCFNSGVVTYNEAATVGYGAIVGNASASGLATLMNSYATTGSCDVLATGNVSVNGDESKSTAEAIAQWLIADNNCKGTNALSYTMDLFTYETADGKYENYWSVVPGKTPILTSFASEFEDEFLAIDTSWYDGSGSYALSDVSDFYGFALLSYKKNFANETITLEEDITVNEGTPYGADGIAGTDDDWNPKYEWVKIGSYDSSNDIYRFNGIFDGQGHTISGIYLQTGQLYSALFGLLDSDGVVKNFSLLNSYVNSSGRSVASVVGHARGTIDTIYSNAIVIGSSSNVGGILGQVDSGGMKSVSNCWFDGQVTNNSNSQSTGGLIGSAGGSITITNCLNTGEVSAPNYTNVEDETSVKPLIGGLIGYAVCTSKISIQNCLNTGNVSFNSVATAGFGSIIGRIGTRSADNTEDQNIVVENTYATSQSCWETVSTSDTWPNITVTVVDNNTIGGESAKDETTGTPGLFDETLTTSWMASEKHPVLKAFEKYASTEKSITALHQWLTSSESLSAKLQNPVTLPNPDQDMTTFFRQGGYTDGQYFYQAYITYKDPGTDEVAAGTGNKVKVLKYDLMSEEYVWSDEMELNHANDITFNSKLGCLVVCHASPNANKVSYINITEGGLVLGEAVELGFNIYNIDYNATKDVYVAEGDSRNFYVLNSDFKKISKAFTPADVSKQHTGQGVSCDDDYIYFVLSASNVVNTEVIAVYDWSGAFVSTITLDIQTDSHIIESENISVVGDKIYIMVAEVVGTAANPTDKPANVYTIDLAVTE